MATDHDHRAALVPTIPGLSLAGNGEVIEE
jgi:hypothetical protein